MSGLMEDSYILLSASVVICCFEVHEENQASHFNINVFFNIHPNSMRYDFLRFLSCNLESKCISELFMLFSMLTSVGLPCTLIFAQRSNDLSMDLSGRKCSPCPIPLPSSLLPIYLHFEWIFISMHGFVMSCIGHLENFGLLSYAYLWKVIFPLYNIRKISHSLISPLIIRKKSNIGKLSTSRWRIQGFQSFHVCVKGEIWSVKTNSHMFSLDLQLSSFIFERVSAKCPQLKSHGCHEAVAGRRTPSRARNWALV